MNINNLSNRTRHTISTVIKIAVVIVIISIVSDMSIHDEQKEYEYCLQMVEEGIYPDAVCEN